jgi:hypothetical protein
VSRAVLAGVLVGLLFDPDGGNYVFLQNVGRLSLDYTVLYFRK